MMQSSVMRVLIVAAIVIGIVFWLGRGTQDTTSMQELAQPSFGDSNNFEPLAVNAVDIPHHIIQKHQRADVELEDLAWIIQELQAAYEGDLPPLKFQVSLIELMADIQAAGPAYPPDAFQKLIEQAFPGHAETIIANIQKMAIYEAWLKDNFIALNQLDLADQERQLWIKRREYFGDRAEEIWDGFTLDDAQRRSAVKLAVDVLDKTTDISVQDKASILYRTYLNQYLGTTEDLTVGSASLLSQTFFGMESVQQELGALEQVPRQQAINDIRRSLGLSEEQVESLATLDRQNNKRWENGYAYMRARNQLTDGAESDGENLASSLHALRVEYFGEQAETIKREEEDLGLYRYERPRVFGRN